MSNFRATAGIKIVISLLLINLLGACQKEVTLHATQPELQTVTTMTLTPSTSYQHIQEFSGTIRAGNTTGIGFELSGKIKQLAVDSGEQVEEGQLLARLDTRLLEAEKLELIASLSQNSADLALATSTLNRSEKLKQQGYTSEQQLDELKGQLASLQAAKKRLEASLQANTLRIEKSSLMAPFDGVISQRNTNLGEVIALGTPVFTLVQNNNPQAFVGVPIKVAQSLKASQAVSLRVADKDYQAKIAGIGAEINPITRTVPLRLLLPQDSKLINGELAYLAYQKTIEQAGFWVPISSLTDGIRGLWNLFVIAADETGAKEESFHIERRDVEIIYTKDDQAYIRGAVNSGEEFISQGLHKLVVGQKVKPGTNVASR
ncbi:efflux RND transporter periplasmic adaptor subunit [uncultured Shewanella sp.]|uniref:efflux RND transporter periplasmic adaptor subunit n=1 Tax=uncultured Shewanella sp. TaxID=173975 RepID=UPI002604CF4C|nr:efflux RND transporter periplasmic adaptor subunit [uncultured Shewanella sp.]